ncbi:hypothetical protein MMIC_P0294 [Mariprofundus micogutta]|uniref:DUF721 domain-containing protein n=1 Tax=Mariprofundus micogutta TaxID=1921010 RepID=A0A1L8CKD3_9PROT|nr:DUF721 domain-containing protein [Mariprofundus micogutta]GAV19360.1 hypothetical protein MMIC_P0294 [Mariprofundus micogutta]
MNFKNKRSRSQLSSVHNNLSEILGEEALGELIGISRLRRAWPDIVGPMMATRTEPVQLEHLDGNGICLWVAVDHSIMSQQIRFLRDQIREACFKHAGIRNLHKIRSRVQPGAGIKAKAPKAKPKRVSFRQKRALAKDVMNIKDRGLRKAIFKAHLAQIAYNEEENK